MDRTILIIEDEQKINDILAFSLGKDGYKTLSAFDGVKGLEMALKENPDLILLDVMLPGMDGFEVCRKVREKSQVPIIMLTAREDEVDKVLGLELGADDYITKPYSMRELTARVKANLRRSTAQPVENVWGYEYYGDVRTVDVTVRRLREKIEDDPSMPKYIITKRGVGYYFNK